MYDDPCPNCGHRRKRMVMSTDPNAPSAWAMFWRGEGEFWQVVMSRLGFVVIGALMLTEVFHLLT